MAKIIIDKDDFKVIERLGSVINTSSGSRYLYFPFWVKDMDGQYHVMAFENLPKELTDAINEIRNG